ncbi:hypothetical protein D4764_07G0010150 [Takifugu flavidus]|uniref:Reverse transcriptase domain-containing protein n=1 Tax=Takifugu flavidus TaxID=433684 RepID=A0A5C6MTA4_9TELE|nr:hypothetical protein D4764_07G0010150 [Takifugu flavidus]
MENFLRDKDVWILGSVCLVATFLWQRWWKLLFNKKRRKSTFSADTQVLLHSPADESRCSSAAIYCLKTRWQQSGAVPLDWQTGVVVPIFKSGDQRVCSNYRGITLLSFPGKVYARVLEKRIRLIVEPLIEEEQCGFRPGRGTTDHLFTLAGVLEGSWEFAQPVHMCFVDLAYDRVPRSTLWGVLREYGVEGPLIRAVQSLYQRSRSLVRIAGCKSDSFPVRVGLRQGCPLSPVRFITFMDRISRCSRGVEGVEFGGRKISSLPFADDVVLLAPSNRDLQQMLGWFATECEAAGKNCKP